MITKRIKEIEKIMKLHEKEPSWDYTDYSWMDIQEEKLTLLKELRAEIEKEIKNLRDMGSFLDNENGLFVRVEDIDDFEQKLIGTKEEK